MDCVVVTGVSGAGKSVVLHALEDSGYFCVDNLPLQLLPSLIDLYKNWGHRLTRIAVGVDVRTGMHNRQFESALKDLRKQGLNAKVLFLDCDSPTLIRRFSETRRRHPLSGSLTDGIRQERRLLGHVKALADKIIDTSKFAPGEIKEVVIHTLGIRHPQGMAVLFMSFGYKFGVPVDADLVWDVRFLPNPNYVPKLRTSTGKEAPVARYALDNPTGKQFMSKMQSMLSFLIKQFSQEGKSYLTIAIGCTGGRHRSVAVAEKLAKYTKKSWKLDVRIRHRDADLPLK